MSDLLVHIDGVAGRITLNRPNALNALTWNMVVDIEAALENWRDDDAVKLVIFEAAGDKAFCSGGDIAEMYATGKAGDFDYGQRFWRDEYRLTRKIFQ
jgi:enoyl-CoA hydratase/carnithine racemase